jgi:hypothetical protein
MDPNLHGQLDSGIDLAVLTKRLCRQSLHAEVRESAHYTGGRYVSVVLGDARLSFECVSEAEYLITGDADDPTSLIEVASETSARLSEAELRHRIEVYDGDELDHYYHWQWPTRWVWVGCLTTRKHLIEAIRAVLSSVGIHTRTRTFDRFPVADPMAGLVATIAASHSEAVWLLEPDDGRERWIEREATGVATNRDQVRHHLWLLDGDTFTSEDGKQVVATSPDAPWNIATGCVPDVDFGQRRLLVVEDTFAVEGRGLIVAPDFSPALLPGEPGRVVTVELRQHGKETRTVEAKATLPFGSPHNPDRPRGYMLTFQLNKSEIVAGTEIWTVPD